MENLRGYLTLAEEYSEFYGGSVRYQVVVAVDDRSGPHLNRNRRNPALRQDLHRLDQQLLSRVGRQHVNQFITDTFNRNRRRSPKVGFAKESSHRSFKVRCSFAMQANIGGQFSDLRCVQVVGGVKSQHH